MAAGPKGTLARRGGSGETTVRTMLSKYYFILIRTKNKIHRFHDWGTCVQI